MWIVKIALNRPEFGNLLGQIVLPDRLLLYRATSSGVVWTQVPVRREDVLTAAAQLDRAVNSPQTPLQAVARAQHGSPGRPAGHVAVAGVNTTHLRRPQRAQDPTDTDSHRSLSSRSRHPAADNVPA